MVLGLRKSRKGISEQVDYLIHVQEINPWPQLQSLNSTQSILLQWENGGRSSGSFTSSGAEDGKIEFNESFSLSATLCRESSKKSTSSDSFQKNYLEFYLYEPKKDKAMKGQLLGTAIINLADHGIIKENITISSPINLKKSSKNMAQPILYINIQPIDRDSPSSSPQSNLSRKISSDKDGSESISELINEEEAGVNSFTDDDDDDDVSSHSSQTLSSSALENARRLHAQNDKSSRNLSSDPRNPKNNLSYPLKFPERSLTSVQKTSVMHSVQSSSLYLGNQHKRGASDNYEKISDLNHVKSEVRDVGPLEDREKEEHLDNGQDKRNLEDFVGKFSKDVKRKQVRLRSNTLAFSREATGAQNSEYISDKLKNIKSVQFHSGSAGGNGNSKLMEKEKETNVPEDAQNGVISYEPPERKKATNSFSDNKVEMESKLEMLEEELREAAAVEVGLYSVIAEHGSSTNKVHAPARRLSRFYFHVCKAKSQAKRANAARAAVSGLVLVSKACGNDVPRLTFWLSNSIVLRAIISQVVGKLQAGPCINRNGGEKGLPNNSGESFDEWEDPQTFIIALEKVEAWIFSRIVESVWWQTLTPHMQPATANGSSAAKKYGRKHGLGDREQGNFSVELWKRAFKDACERLCPIRAGGHECGCLPVLSKLVMQQLVGRLDVAMFNAILRESAEEMPTDPVSDPISDWKVLPIPASKSSFGAGAQLKNAIGSWSRWLTDIFDIDENDSPPVNLVNYELGDETSMECEPPFKAFHLLNSLSDLMMLPFEMLADKSTRKEVCPTFSAPLIRRVLSNYVPDEFSPDPIPDTVLEALDSEDLSDAEDELTTIPCNATMTVYSPPSATSLIALTGEVEGPTLLQNSSSVLKKSYTSDDELDELDSPISSIVTDNSKVSLASSFTNPLPTGNAGRKIVRYQLLREVWKDGK